MQNGGAQRTSGQKLARLLIVDDDAAIREVTSAMLAESGYEIQLAEDGRETRVELHKYPTDRATFKDLTSQAALDLLRRRLREALQKNV